MESRGHPNDFERPVFVVSPGRSGSTAVSDALNLHPDLAMFSEFFVLMYPFDPPLDDECEGNDFWAMLARPHPVISFLTAASLEPPEIRYPFHEGGLLRRGDPVPAILATALPALSDDPDALYVQLEPKVRTFPRQKVAKHFQRLGNLVTDITGARGWGERSGGSLLFVAELRECFADRRFIVVLRDPIETVVSMSRHNIFRAFYLGGRFKEAIGIDPYDAFGRPLPRSNVPDELFSLLPDHLDRDRFDHEPVDLGWFAGLWSGMMAEAWRQLSALTSNDVLVLTYEEFADHPLEGLIEPVARFLGLEWSEAWQTAVRALIHPARPLPTELVPEHDLIELRALCEEGMEAAEKLIEKFASREIGRA